MLTQSQFSQIQFQAVLNHYGAFYSIMKAIHFVDNVTVQLTSDGVKIIAEEAKSVQATAYIMKNCFSEYKLTLPRTNTDDDDEDDPCTSFGLNLKVFTDCLSMFLGGDYDSSLKLLHKGEGAPLIVVLEQHGEDDLVTECSVKTMEPLEVLDFDFEDAHVFSRVNIKAPDFFALLSDLDRFCEEIEIFLSPNSPHFRLATFGELHSESNFEITNCSDMLISFNCTKTSTNRYKFAHFRLVMKTLALGSKIALRTNKDGLLGMQVLVETGDSAQMFVEYFIMPLCEDEDTMAEGDTVI
uniref:Putative checkpoint 9-1-1 complex rad1 component n=1 Tax=Culex tarsalis TaxID=7177 RepID=A0A1Q3F250_CULTA